MMMLLVNLLTTLINEYGMEKFKTAVELAALNSMPRGMSLAALQIAAKANQYADASIKIRRVKAAKEFLFENRPYTLSYAKLWVEENFLDNGYGDIKIV